MGAARRRSRRRSAPTDEQVAALERDDIEAGCFSEPEQRRAALHHRGRARRARVGRGARRRSREALSPREVVELLMVIGQYMMVARVMATTHMELDEPVDPAALRTPMTSVRDASYDLLRAHGLTTVFGNPGSTELPFLSAFPADFRYVLGLQEAIVVGMADGYAQASGRPTLVNLHTAPGVGNAMGALFNARENKSPLVVTAGQQVRAMMTMEALLTNRDATTLPRPGHEVELRAAARRRTCPPRSRRATHLAALPPRGPVFVSIPMDDWAAEADEQTSPGTSPAARVAGRTAPDPEALARPRAAARQRRRTRCSSPGPTSTRAAPGTRPSRSPSAAGCRCGRRPRPGRGRLGFPENHPHFQGILPPAIAAGRADARGPRPRAGRGRGGVHLLPLHPGAAAARGRVPGAADERSGRGGARADGRRDRRRRGARAGGAARAGARVGAARAARRARRPSRRRTRDPITATGRRGGARRGASPPTGSS